LPNVLCLYLGILGLALNLSGWRLYSLVAAKNDFQLSCNLNNIAVLKKVRYAHGTLCPMPHAPCPMPSRTSSF
ncbi:MAG: hypothetical protein WBL95_01695, partial [Microcoleus sp.]